MFLGHYGVALAAKRIAPKTSLGTLILASQLVDLLWPIFLLFGLEHVRIDPGNTRVTPLDFYDYPLTHSLLGAGVWAAALGFLYFLRRHRETGARAAWVVAGVVLSHWFLDALVHRPDLLLVPGGGTYVGLGLWNSLTATAMVELGFLGAGLFLYLCSTRAKDKTGRYALWSLIAFLVLIWVANVTGPPPPNWEAVAYVGLAGWLLVWWGWWIDRHRVTAPIGGAEN